MNDLHYKVITLDGRQWRVWKDAYRFYIRSMDDDRRRYSCLEFKNDEMDLASYELAHKLFTALPDERSQSSASGDSK